MDFYFIVSAIAVVLLVLTLTFFGVLMQYKNSGQSYPTTLLKCPDYWTVDSTGKCVTPTNPNLNKIVDPTAGTSFLTATPGLTTSASGPPYAINFADGNWTNGTTAGITYKESWNPAGVIYDTSLCAWNAWSKYYNVHWDGVSNTNEC
jgi:hypothetical protein